METMMNLKDRINEEVEARKKEIMKTFNYLFGAEILYRGEEYKIIGLEIKTGQSTFKHEGKSINAEMELEPYLIIAKDFNTVNMILLEEFLKLTAGGVA